MSDATEEASTPLTRQSIRTPRAAGVAGVAFAVLLTSTFLLVRLAVPAEPDDTGTWLEDGGRRKAVLFGLNLVPFAGIAFLWFIGVVRDRIGAAEDRLFATVFLGSGLLFIAMLFATGAIAGGLVLMAEDEPEIGVWLFGRRTIFTLFSVYAMRMAAVFTISTTTIAWRLGLAPRWLTVSGVATGLLLMLTSGAVAWVDLVFPAWVFVFSIHILRMSFRSEAPGTAPQRVER